MAGREVERLDPEVEALYERLETSAGQRA